MPDTQDLVVLLDNTSRGDKLAAAAKGIVDILHGIEPPSTKASLVDELLNTLATGSARDAIARYRELKTKAPDKYDFSEGEVNRLGYALLQRGRAADAIDVLLLNVEEHPKSWNAYDSLAEAYAAHGDRDLAVANYQKSLQLNPRNANAAEALKKLQK
jgi:predicted Zn-dependent protease